MIKRNTKILCFLIVLFITLMTSYAVSAADNTDTNITNTQNNEITAQTVEVINEKNENTINTNKALAQSEENTIEETDDQNAVKNEENKTKAKTINKVLDNTQNVKTATALTSAGNYRGDYELTGNLNLGTGKINITGSFTLDGHGYTITRSGTGTTVTTSGGVSNILIKNVIFKDTTGTATLSFSQCRNVTIENCTFINCAKGSGVIENRAGSSYISDMVISDVHFYNTTGPLVYSNPTNSYVSLCQVYNDDKEITYLNLGSAASYLGYTQAYGNFILLSMEVENARVNQNNHINISLIKQSSSTAVGQPPEAISGPVDYVVYDPDNINIASGSGLTNTDGIYPFTLTFDKKGRYTIPYNFLGISNYDPIGGTKYLTVYEDSILSDIALTSINEVTGIEVQATLKNSTGSVIIDAPVSINLNGHIYTGYTNDEGVATILIPYSEYGHHYYDAIVSYGGDEELFIAPSEEYYDLDLTKPLTVDTSVIPVSPIEGFTGDEVILTANIVDKNNDPVTSGSVTFSVDGTPLTGDVTFEDGVATIPYTISTTDVVNVLVTYAGDPEKYKDSTGTIVVNRISIPTNLTISNIPENIKVGEEFNFNIQLTNRTGEAITGKVVKVYVNDVEIEGLSVTDSEGNVNVPYTPINNNELNIRAEYITDNIYLTNSTELSIPSSSISLIDTVIGVDYEGNASIGDDFVIKVNLTANDELLDANNITVLIDLQSASEHHEYDSESKILTITINPSEVTVYHFHLVYPGLTGVYSNAEEYFTVNVNKIKTSTFVDYAEYDPEKVILMIYFLDDDGNKIYEHATFHVNMNNSNDERQDFNMDNLDDPSYKWNITQEDGIFYVQVDSKFYRENGWAYAYITFNGTDIYEKSTHYVSEMEVKEEITIRLDTYEDDEHTIRKNVFYINDTVNIYLDLINQYGWKNNGGINVSIANNKFPENAFELNDQTSSNVLGFSYPYKNVTSGEYTITVKYKGSGAYNPTSITRTFTLIKLESSTTARIINNTAGNVTLGIKVKDNNDLPIKRGNLTVEVNGVPRVVPFNIDDEEVIVNLNSIGLGITTTSEIPITITYQGSDIYASSEAVDEETGNTLSSINADKGVNNITVNLNPEDVTIDNMFDVSGYLRELDGTPVLTGNVNITIINPDGSVKSSNNVSTNGNGYFTNSYTATLEDYPAGEYTVNVSYYDADHNLTTVQKTLTVSKVSTNVAATVENRTNGNITVRVKVTDNRGNPVGEGKVNITDSTGEILYKDVEVNANGEAVLVIDSITEKGTNSFIVNYAGTDKYDDSTTSDGLTNVEVLLRDLTINTTIVNSTYNNVSFEVNITDTTTGKQLPGKEFKVLDANDNVLGTYTTGNDGTIVISDIDLSTGSQTLYINYTDSVSYTSKKVPVTINVQPRESKVNATVTDTKAGEVTVRVNATDATTGEAITSGIIVITDNGKEVAHYQFNDVADGIVEVPTEIIDSGSHNLVVTLYSTNYENSNYTDSSLANVNVDKRNVTVEFEPVNSTIGNTTVKVTLTDEDATTKIVNGTVNVYSDEEKTNLIGTACTDENGVVIVNVITTADTNQIYVEYAGNITYNENTTTESLTLEKRQSNINASLVSSKANDVTVRVNVTDATTGEPITEGTIIIKDGDKIVAEVPITENPGFIDVKTDITESGEHSLTVEYKGTEVYDDSVFDDTEGALKGIDVAKRNTNVVYEVVNSTYEDTVIKVTILDEDGITPIVNGQVNIQLPESTEIIGQNTTDNDGVTYIKVNAPVTTTSLTLNYTGNITYNENVTTQDIQITPRAINVNATVTNTTAGNVTIKVNITDAVTKENVRTGKVNITNNGEVVAEIDLETATFEEDGTILIYTNVNQTGKYRLTTEYDGRPEYGEEFYNLEAFTVTPKESELTATVPNTVKGNTTVNVTFTDPVTGELLNGTVYVSVNGGKPVPVEVVDGKGGIPADLPIGDNNIKVVFDGDEKYDETETVIDVTVSPRDINVDYEITNNTQGNVTIKVTVDDAETGEGVNTTVIVYVDDTPVEVEIVDGVGTAVLDIPVTGGEISVYHEEDDTYSEVPRTVPEHVDVVKRESSITAEPVGTSANDTSVKVTLRDPVTDKPITSGTIVITDNGVEVARIEFSEETGEVIVPTNITTSGKHNLNVTFEGNENYTSSNYTDDTLSDINIANRTANITVTPNNNTYGNTTIDVSVVDSETGDALPSGGIVKVYDEEGNEVGEGTLKEDGTVTIPIDVPIDTTKVTVKYLGNTTSYDPAETTYEDLSLDPRASKIEAEVTNTTAGNITVKVNVTDATTGDKLETGKITITDNTGEPVAIIDLENDEYTVDEDGSIVIYTNIEETGRYKLSVTYENAPEYDESSVNTEAFTVTPKESQLTVDVPNKVKSNTTVNVTLTDPVTGENLNGNVSVYIDGVKQDKTLEIIDGKGGDLFDIPVGEHTVKVVFDGDEKYSTTSEETTITVEPRKINVEATLTNTTQGNITLEVTVTDDETGVGVNGTVVVTLPNGTDVEVEVVDGKGVAVLDIPIGDSTGETLKVTYPADGENEETTVFTDNALSIAPRSSKVVAEVTNPVADKTEVTVTVTDPVTGGPVTSGEVSVKLEGTEIGRLPVGSDGTVVIPVDLPNKGDYDLTVTFEGNENYTSDTTEITDITIEGSTSELEAEVVNSTQGNVTIKVDLVDPVTGDVLPLTAVNVTLPDGTTQEYPVNEDGTITVPLDVGENDIVISYPGDDTYNATEIPVKVNVEPRESSIEAEVTNTTAGNITVKVNITDATTGEPITSGTVDITLNGEVVGTVDLSEAEFEDDGTVIISTNIENIGNYALVAKYSGDENYTANNYNIESFDATPKESDLTIDIPNHVKGNTTLDISFTDPVTGEALNGTVYVIINGEQPGKPVKIVDGVPETELLLDLPVGENTVKVEFDGDKKYNATSDEIPITVEPRKINVEATLTNTTQGNITIEVTVTDDETGVGVNGTVLVTLPNGTDVEVEVVDGKGVAVLDIPISDSNDKPLVVKYPADGENEETIVTTDNSLTVETRESKVEAVVSDPVANKTTVTVTVTDPVTGEPVTSGKVTVKDGDKVIGEAEVGPDGTVTVPVDLATSGTYDLNVTFEGNENYTSTSENLDDVEIVGRQSQVETEIVNTTQGNVTIKVDLVDPVTNETLPITAVNVTLPDGTTQEYPISEDGTINVPLPVGENNIVVSYPGDDTYNKTEIPVTVNVTQREAKVEANVINSTAGNTTVQVTVTDPVTGEPVTSGEVVLTVNGEEVGKLPVGPDGTVTIPTSIAKTGSTSIVATYNGNENYTSSKTTADNVEITPKESELTAQLTNNTQGDTKLEVKLFDPVTGTPLNGKVTITLPDASRVDAVVENGTVTVPVDLPTGNSTLKVTYMGNETYDSIHYDVPVSVNKRPTTVESSIANNTAGNVTVGVKVSDQLTNTPLSSGRVLVYDGNNLVGVATLNSNGEAIVKTNITTSDEHDLKVVYEGDNNHEDNTTSTDKVKVSPRKTSVKTEIPDTTVGDTKVNITLTDPVTDTPIDGEVIVTLPNGTNITAKSENGNVIVPVDLPAGDNEITVTYPGNSTYDDITVKVPLKVNKRSTNTEVTELNSDAGNVELEVKVTDKETGKPVTGGEVTVYSDGKEVGKAQVKDGVAIIDAQIAKAGNYNLDIKYAGTPEYEPVETTHNQKVTPREVNVDVKVLNNTVADTKIQVNVTDKTTGKAVPNENVIVTLPNGTKITVTTDKNGIATIDTELLSGNNNIQVTYNGGDVYNTSTTNITANTEKAKVKVTVDSVEGIIGEKIVLTAHVTDEYGNPVTGGNLVFKLNGRSLRTDLRFDTNNTDVYKLTVKNGIVTIELTADLYLRAGKNITASYSGSSKYLEAKGNVAEANIRKRTAEVTVTTSPKIGKQDKDIVFTAKISDVTQNSSKSLVNNDAYVLFKVNGNTLKDANGENIKVKVVNGVAKYTYHIPLGTSGMVDGHMRDYIVTAVYSSPEFYPDSRATTAYNVERSKTSINLTSATVKDDTLSIKAKILDQYGYNVIGNNQVTIKINGKTFKINGKTTVTVKDGNINISGLKLNGNKVKSLTIVTGERQSYYESSLTTTKIETL